MPPAPVMIAKNLHYHADGSGRDTYINVSSGGLAASYTPGEYGRTFKTSLRSYNRTESCGKYRNMSGRGTKKEKSDFFVKSQNHFGYKHDAEMKQFSNYMKGLDQRLSRPKHVAVKR